MTAYLPNWLWYCAWVVCNVPTMRRADSSLACMRALLYFGTAMARMMKMIATTIISSIKVKPRRVI